jgi:hypothetical protein
LWLQSRFDNPILACVALVALERVAAPSSGLEKIAKDLPMKTPSRLPVRFVQKADIPGAQKKICNHPDVTNPPVFSPAGPKLNRCKMSVGYHPKLNGPTPTRGPP